MRALIRTLACAAPLLVASAIACALRAEELQVGTPGTASDAPFFIADKKGYFRDEGLTVHFIRFDSAAKMIPSLGSGELDVGGGATSAGLYNAVKRGVGIKIVADKARNAKGHGFQGLMVRKELVDSGKFKRLSDLKGLKVALSAAGNSEASLLNGALRQGGLKLSDVELVYLGFPQHTAAFQNGAIDAAITTEPTLTQIVKTGSAVRFLGADEFFPDHQTAVTFYGAEFIKRKPEATGKFMRALIHAIRFYNDALDGGRLAGRNAEETIAILVEYSHIKDPAVHRTIISHAVDPNGEVHLDSLRKAWQLFVDTRQIDGSVSVDDVIDMSFARAAVGALGPYRRAGTH